MNAHTSSSLADLLKTPRFPSFWGGLWGREAPEGLNLLASLALDMFP